MTSLLRHLPSHGFQICIFVELRIDYQRAKFQHCRLSVASFIDGLRKHNDDVIMTSSHAVEI